nr:MAG TPA: hypothetical protein [Caudoviricetes sp.]
MFNIGKGQSVDRPFNQLLFCCIIKIRCVIGCFGVFNAIRHSLF